MQERNDAVAVIRDGRPIEGIARMLVAFYDLAVEVASGKFKLEEDDD